MAVKGSGVPMFKLRPYGGMLIAALFVAVVGGLISAYFFYEDAYSDQSRGFFALVVTVVLVLLFVVAAFSRYGFKHLRHHRPGYKRG
jgi:hypothetical protein